MNNIVKKIQFADKVASRSKDSSTKVGAVFYTETETHPISFGYNGMPRGLDDTNKERNERPEKYQWYEHAERNAIYNAARPILQDKIIFVSHYPNMESARGIVSSGIKKIVTSLESYNKDNEMHKKVSALFFETGVVVELVDFNNHPSFEEYSKSIVSENPINSILEKKLKKQYSKKDKLHYYLELTIDYANSKSLENIKNPEAAIVFDEDYYNPISAGVFGPPENLILNEDIINNQEMYYQEAVKNAIYNSVREKLKNSVADVTWCPCSKCALAIISVGSKKVRTRQPDFTQEADKRWESEFKTSQEIFKSASIDLELISSKDLEISKKPKGNNKL